RGPSSRRRTAGAVRGPAAPGAARGRRPRTSRSCSRTGRRAPGRGPRTAPPGRRRGPAWLRRGGGRNAYRGPGVPRRAPRPPARAPRTIRRTPLCRLPRTGRRTGSRAALPLPQAQRAHVDPVLVDVVQAALPVLRRGAGLPAGRQLTVGRPQGVLLLVVGDDDVQGAVGGVVGGRTGGLGHRLRALRAGAVGERRDRPLPAVGCRGDAVLDAEQALAQVEGGGPV